MDSVYGQARRRRHLNIGLLAVLGGMALLGAARPEQDASLGTITYRAWKVIDRDGKVRIDAGTDADGDANVWWTDKDGKVRLEVKTAADGTAIFPTPTGK